MSEEREQKNSVFGGTQNIPSTTAAERVKAEFGLDIPIETVPLPSQGRVYPPDSALYNVETVEIRAMTAREEDILTSRALHKKGTMMNELMKSCLIDKTINPLDMLSGDRSALMVAIRITGYGEEYAAENECSECQFKGPVQFDLSKLPYRTLDIEPVTPGSNVFTFTLPRSKKLVKFKFSTGRDELELYETAERQKKAHLNGDATVTSSLTSMILSVDGIEDRTMISRFVKMMPAMDSLALRSYITNNEPSVMMKQEVTCSSCGHCEEVSMPMGASFFWPST